MKKTRYEQPEITVIDFNIYGACSGIDILTASPFGTDDINVDIDIICSNALENIPTELFK